MDVKQHIKDYSLMYTAGAIALTILGGSIVVELPADKKIAALEVQVAQTWQQREAYHQRQEIETIQWRLRYITNEINRINQIPRDFGRSISPQEALQVEQLKQEFRLLQERLQRLLSSR